MLRRAKTADARVRFVGKPVHQSGSQSRLADARFTGEQDDLPLARLGLGPAPKQEFALFFPPDQCSQATLMQRLEAALYGARPQHRPGPHSPSDALEFLRANILNLKERTQQSSCAFGDDDTVWLRNSLEPCCEIWRLPDDAPLLRFSRSDQVTHNNQPGCDADAGLQGCAGLQPGQCRDEFQPGMHRPLGIVLMGLRISKINKDAIAHILRYKTFKPTNGLGRALLVGRNDLSEVLRVH